MIFSYTREVIVRPTIEVEVTTDSVHLDVYLHQVHQQEREALELRDGDKSRYGKGVLKSSRKC